MVMRTYGLSGSGMDVDQMVKDLMKARRVSYDRLWQKKVQAEWKKADYNTMYSEIRNLRSTVYTNTLQSTLSPKKTTSSNETVAVATATGDAASVEHDLVVTSLASGVTKSSTGAVTTGTAKDTLINQFGSDQTGTSVFKVKITNGSLSKEIDVDPNKSIYEFVSSINNAGVNVKANYDATLDRFFLYTADTGAAASIDFTGSSAEGMNFLANDLLINTAPQTGANAVIKLDGVDLTPASNNVTISGVNYLLKNSGNAKVSVVSDTDKAVANVKAFVEAYNNALGKINSELGENLYRDYLPLTNEQKADMSESQVKDWESNAKSGLLRHDSVLSNAVYKIRNDLSAVVSGVSGKYNSAAAIGITTGDYTEGGKLYLNEEALRKALAEDADAVYKVFGTSGSTAGTKGIAVRLNDTLKTVMDSLSKKAGVPSLSGTSTIYDQSEMGRQIGNYATQLSTMDYRLQQTEDRYYRQFDAMEAALSRMNQQSSWLASQLGSK